jgi:hypothetical protein
VQYRWPVILGGIAIFCLVAETALSASPTGKAVETETIIVPSEDFGIGDPGLNIPAEPDTNDEPANQETFEPQADSPEATDSGPPPTVEYDAGKLPPPVRRLREQIIEAALSGDIEKLQPIFDANGEPPAISFNQIDDPIGQLRALAGDEEGREILAILIEVLEAGYVHVDVGTPDEMYVWPYFARYPVDALTGPQMVELFKLLTAGDYEEMKIYGTYLFYRVGIAPNGVWRFFLAGD